MSDPCQGQAVFTALLTADFVDGYLYSVSRMRGNGMIKSRKLGFTSIYIDFFMD